ncbi:MAG: putative metal-dependent hydrolase [Limisphaerales bacterium]
MSGKDHKVAALLEGVEAGPHDPHFVGYIRCFNEQKFYEAHDVLEALWLQDRHGPDGDFFKGLIQFAGAFVHLQKQRPRPASKLFRLCATYLANYPSPHLALDVANVLRLAKRWGEAAQTLGREGDLLAKQAPPKLRLQS